MLDSNLTELSLQDATSIVEEDIVFGRLHPRERLVEEELMERFSMKRHVARDLLMNLERMGLVERRKNIGAFVRSFTPEEVIELYQLRILLENQAIELIQFPINNKEIEHLIELQKKHDEAVHLEDPRQVFRINQEFHQELYSLCKNKILIQAISEYARQTHPIRFVSLIDTKYREKSRLEHWSMIEALQSGNREKLLQLCSDHLTPSRDAYLKINEVRSR
jgi:DNA-binding GntR family transcriptional regulator